MKLFFLENCWFNFMNILEAEVFCAAKIWNFLHTTSGHGEDMFVLNEGKKKSDNHKNQ